MKKARCLELRTADGKVILILYLTEREVDFEDDQKQPVQRKPENKEEKPRTNTSQDQEPGMTQAQKRYLFRLLAERGMEGDKAYERLKELFQVDSLKEVTKLEASKAIEHLLGKGKEADDGIPF